ncbi:MAG: MFS transporter, partial [Atopobium sp.]|nr:MFS transporter [Atopobium sp.]
MFKRELNAKLVLSVIATGIMSFSGVVVETAMNVTFLCGFAAPTFMLLLLGRILEGIGTGLALPLMFNIITEQAPLKNMGVMMGIGMLVTAVAPAVGPSAGGWIAEHLGWRMIFAGLLPFLIVAFVLGISSIQQSHETEVISFDVFGWLLLTVSFIALIFVIDESSAFGLLSIPVLLAIMIFVGSLMFFVRHENSFKHQEQSNKSTKIPIINLEVFSEKGFVLSLFAIVALQFIILGQ